MIAGNFNRRKFLRVAAAGAAASCAGPMSGCGYLPRKGNPPLCRAEQEDQTAAIEEGVRMAVKKYLDPALLDRIYLGHFIVAPDGGFGTENTWPGLDGWQMAGAYLLLGRTRVVLDYFDFVQASQRADGNIPFAIFPGEQSPGSLDSWLRGLNFPADVYSY